MVSLYAPGWVRPIIPSAWAEEPGQLPDPARGE
jgi:hypothetical protein